MDFNNRVSFGNLWVSKYVKNGAKTINVKLGEIGTTKLFDQSLIKLCDEEKISGTHDIEERVSQLFNTLIGSVVKLDEGSNFSHIIRGITEGGKDFVQLSEKNAYENGGYLLTLLV